MRDHRRLLAVAFTAVLAACSGGGGSSDPIPAGTCQRAAIPSTGPGDTLNYFPSEVGRTWTYRNESSAATALVAVSGSQVVGSETALVFTSTTAGSPPAPELVVKRPAGVYVLSDPSAEPPFDQLYPSLVLPFPVAVMPAATQATCRALDVGDLDGDGKTDHADITLTLAVFSVSETATIAAGSFVEVAHVQTLASIKATTTAAGTLDMVATEDDWYAKGVGRVLSLLKITIPTLAVSESVTTSLQSWTLPTAAALVSAPLAASEELEARPAPRLEEAALRLARSALAAPR